MNKDNIVDEIKSQNKWEIVHSGQFTNRDALMLNGQKVIVLEHYTEEPQRDKIKGNIIEALSKYDTVAAQNKCLLEALQGIVDYWDSDLSEAEAILLEKAKAAIETTA